jgi:hypothetical protein
MVYAHSRGMISVRVDSVSGAALEAVKRTALFKALEDVVGSERAVQVASTGGRAREIRAGDGSKTPP